MKTALFWTGGKDHDGDDQLTWTGESRNIENSLIVDVVSEKIPM